MSNSAGEQASTKIQSMSEHTGRFIKEDEEVINIANVVEDMYYNTTLVNGKPAGTAFGADYVVANEIPVLAQKFNMGLNLVDTIAKFNTSGYIKITTNETTLELGPGTDPGGKVELYSKRRIRYNAGSPGYEKITVAFVDPALTNGDLDCGAGICDGEDGYLFKQEIKNGTDKFYFIVMRNGLEEKKVEFNGNFDDYNKYNLNIYRLVYGYLGVAETELYRRNEEKTKFDLIHKQNYDQRTTSVLVPELPTCGFIENKGNTNNVNIVSGSLQIGIIDGASSQKRDVNTREEIYSKVHDVTSGITTIFAFKNPLTVDMYDYIDKDLSPTIRNFKNVVASDLKLISTATDTNKNVTLDLYITDIDNINGTFTSVELGYSVLSVSEDATVIDRAELRHLKSFQLGKTESDIFNIVKENLLLPGQVTIFEATCTGAGELEISMEYQDLF